MKRDMDLIRLVLLNWESGGVDFTGYSEGEQIYHSALLIEAGYLKGEVIPGDSEDGSGVAGVCVNGLTWAGHDFLDAARNQTIWNKVRDAISGSVGTAGIETFRKLLTKAIAGQLGLGSDE
jgi:Hypothetical protein (DUF2513)